MVVQYSAVVGSTAFLQEYHQVLVQYDMLNVLGLGLIHRDTMRSADPQGKDRDLCSDVGIDQ